MLSRIAALLPLCSHANGFAEGALCADASTTLTNNSSASLNGTMQYLKIIAERFTYHFAVAAWRTKAAESAEWSTGRESLTISEKPRSRSSRREHHAWICRVRRSLRACETTGAAKWEVKGHSFDWTALEGYYCKSYTSTSPTPVVLLTPRTIAV
jgi:hypothetical protein